VPSGTTGSALPTPPGGSGTPSGRRHRLRRHLPACYVEHHHRAGVDQTPTANPATAPHRQQSRSGQPDDSIRRHHRALSSANSVPRAIGIMYVSCKSPRQDHPLCTPAAARTWSAPGSDLTGGRKIDPQTLIVHADHGRTGHPGSGPNICLARNRACKASSDAAPGLTGELESDPRIISQPPSELNRH